MIRLDQVREAVGEGGDRQCAAPAEQILVEAGIDAEIIDLRSLWPLDLQPIVDSVKKTGRCVIVPR